MLRLLMSFELILLLQQSSGTNSGICSEGKSKLYKLEYY